MQTEAAADGGTIRIGLAPISDDGEAQAIDAARRLAAAAPEGGIAMPDPMSASVGLSGRPLTGVFLPSGELMRCVAVLSGDRPHMTARLADVLEGYTQFRDFDPRELHLIEPLRTLRMMHYAAWLARRWEDPAFPRAFPYFNTERYWGEHILALREQAALMSEPPLVWD